MGDAGLEAEYQLMKEYPDLKVDVLVLGHHGSIKLLYSR
jgi:competence protein ComEC